MTGTKPGPTITAAKPFSIRALRHFWDPFSLKGIDIDWEIFIRFPFNPLVQLSLEWTFRNCDKLDGPTYAEIYFNLAVDFWNGQTPIIDSGFDPQNLDGSNTLTVKLAAYSNDVERAIFCLGVALHVVQDVICPVHAVNTIAESKVIPQHYFNDDWGPQEHAQIESEFSDYLSSYSTPPLGDWLDLSVKKDWEGNPGIKGFVHQAALIGRGENDATYDIICDLNHPDWEATANELFIYGDSITTSLLLYFWQIVEAPDIDGDYLTIQEESETYGTNPTERDSDFDGINDGDEVAYWTDDHYNQDWYDDPDNDGVINLLDDDSDNDGILDGEEIILGTDGFITNPALEDTDNDNLDDLDEILGVYGYYTDPTNDDTDEDGYDDGDEIFIYNTDPTDSNDNPPCSWVPESVISYFGISNQVSKITLYWTQPANYQPGWYYQIWRKPQYYGSYESITPTPVYATSFQHTPPSLYTSYTYRIACFNLNGQHGPYSYWTGKVKGGGGPI